MGKRGWRVIKEMCSVGVWRDGEKGDIGEEVRERNSEEKNV